MPSSYDSTRRGRVLTAVAVLAALVSFVAVLALAPDVQADPAPLSALVLRNGDTTIVRQPDDTTTVNLVQGTVTSNGTDYPVFDINSQVGSDTSTFVSLSVSADLTPGTYATTRTGDLDAVLDPGSFLACGGDEPGTLTVTQADYDEAGAPIDFAASFDVGCDSTPTAHGEIRWNSSIALALAQAPSSTSTTVTVGSSADVVSRFTAVGNSPTTLGAATLSQATVPDDSLTWSIVSDGCAGQTLQPGASCTVTSRISPMRPDGYPHGTVRATMSVPDGQSIPATTQVAADVYPLSGQVLGLQAHGEFRQVLLTWSRPALAPAGWSYDHQQYAVYRYLSDGSLDQVAFASNTAAVVGGLPDASTTRFVVRDLQSGADAPLSVPASATTATSELVFVGSGGTYAQQLAPQSDDTAYPLVTNPRDLSNDATGGLTVARNQSRLAYSVRLPAVSTLPSRTYACLAGVDTPAVPACSGGYSTTQWDTSPAVSPTGSRWVVSHAATPGGATTLETSSTATTWAPAVVPNSAGLSDPTFNAAGTGLVAVQAVGDTTQLVNVSLTGTRTAIAGSGGLTQPDVAADGRIVATRGLGLVVLAPGATAAVPLAGVPDGANSRPHFSPDGRRVLFTHVTTSDVPTVEGDQLDLATGTLTTLVQGNTGTPFVLGADGTHGADTTAPTASLAAPTSLVDLASTVAVSWNATDSHPATQISSGVRSYDVRYRTASATHTFGAYVYPPTWQATEAYSASMKATPGYEYCFSARARDFAGNVSAWTAERCTAAPTDDRSLSTTGSRHSSTNYYRGTFSYAIKTGTRFTLGGVTARRIGILATTCAACGQASVTLGSRSLGKINTHATSTHYRQTLWLPTTTTLTGTLTISTSSTAELRIDGVVVQH